MELATWLKEWACMVGAPGNVGLLRFSTDELPERERLLMFQEIFGRAITKIDFEPVAGTHLRVQATVRAIPGLGACNRRTPRRHPALRADAV
jgi:hypothetical protein